MHAVVSVCGIKWQAGVFPYQDYPFTPGEMIEEKYRRIDAPTLRGACELVEFWNDRPADGVVMGRDIPSRRIASLLSNIMLWELIENCTDARLRLAGETLRRRFGGNAVGQRFRDLVAPSVADAFLEKMEDHALEDDCVCFDMHLHRNIPIEGVSDLHFELVIFPVWAADHQKHMICNGLFYF